MFAKIINNKVVRLSDEYVTGYLHVIEAYPTLQLQLGFYEKGLPTFQVKEKEVDVLYDYKEIPIDTIKPLVFDLQKNIRQRKQLGSFTSSGINFYIKDKEDSLIISSLTEETTDFKIGVGEWVSLDIVGVKQLKVDHNTYVKAAYSWEKTENTKVMNMNSLAEINQYLLINGWEL